MKYYSVVLTQSQLPTMLVTDYSVVLMHVAPRVLNPWNFGTELQRRFVSVIAMVSPNCQQISCWSYGPRALLPSHAPIASIAGQFSAQKCTLPCFRWSRPRLRLGLRSGLESLLRRQKLFVDVLLLLVRKSAQTQSSCLHFLSLKT